VRAELSRHVLLKARQFEFVFPRPTLVMGVLNVTPDSFSDGGMFLEPEAAVRRGLEMVEEGADIIDIGGESTRPHAVPVSQEEELGRVLPVIKRLTAVVGVPLSIDTMKVEVARAALAAGVSMINDVAANRVDETMWRLVGESGAGYVCMHMQGTPATMQTNPAYTNVVAEVEEFFRERLARLGSCGVEFNRIILDPGIGFGKGIEHNLELLGSLKRLARLDRPLLLGVSRKSFLGKVSGAEPKQRLSAALACACLAVQDGVRLIRTHDVAETVQAIRMTEAVLSHRKE
jgi:dihydropteroate synthase